MPATISGNDAAISVPRLERSTTRPASTDNRALNPSHFGYALLSCPRVSSTGMSITGWRVHFARRDLAWPREVDPFIREFSALFAGLNEGLDDLGVPDGQPFLISPPGGYDVALHRYFSVWLASSPWNTQAAHARDLRSP